MIKDKIATLSAGSTRTNTLPTASTSSAHKVTVDPDRSCCCCFLCMYAWSLRLSVTINSFLSYLILCNVILFGNAEDNRQGSGCLERACAEVTWCCCPSWRIRTGCFSHRQLYWRQMSSCYCKVEFSLGQTSGSWRLSKNDDLKGIYINADEPRELRMCRTFVGLSVRCKYLHVTVPFILHPYVAACTV